MEHQHPVTKGLAPDLLIRLLGSATLTGKRENAVCLWACERVAGVKSVKYSSSEGRRINLATPTFFNLDWQVNCRDGDILSSSRFPSIPLWSRVALHHVCQRELYWRTLRLDWMPGAHWCVRSAEEVGVSGAGVGGEWLYRICRHQSDSFRNKLPRVAQG